MVDVAMRKLRDLAAVDAPITPCGQAAKRVALQQNYVHLFWMDRLDESERRLDRVVARVEQALAASAKGRADAAQGLKMAEAIETRAELALKHLRDVVRQQEGQ